MTTPRIRQSRVSALAFAGYELTEAYKRNRDVLRKAILYDGPFEPEHQRDGGRRCLTRRLEKARAYATSIRTLK